MFRNPSLRLVALSRIASVTGRWAANVALTVVAFRRGGAEAVALLGVVRIVGATLAGPLSVALLGRMRSDRVLLVAGVVRTAAFAGAGALLLATGGLVLPFALVGLESLASTSTRPLQNAALPYVAQRASELTAANLTLSTIETSGMLTGPLLSGALLAVSRPGTVLVAAAAVYALATLLLALVPAWEARRDDRERQTAFADTLHGLRAIGANARLRLVVGLYCAGNLVSGLLNVLVVVAALDLLELSNSGVSVLNGAIGVGGVAGALVVGAFLGRSRIAGDLGRGLVVLGAPIAGIAALPHVAPTVAMLVVLGCGLTIVDFTAITLMQRTIPDDVLTRAFSLLQSGFIATLGIGGLLAPVLVSALGVRGALLAAGFVLPVLAVLRWKPLVRLDETVAAADEAVELLRSNPVFAPLALPTLERLARALVPLEVKAGEAVVRQGDPGDGYYLVRAGELRVEVDGEPVRTLGVGDGFGEIALLHDVPRTATVVAAGDALLYALDREPFLDVVAGSASSRRAADELVEVRLGFASV